MADPTLRIHFGMGQRDTLRVAEVLGIRVTDRGTNYRFDPPGGGPPVHTYKSNKDVNGEVIKLLQKTYHARKEQERQAALAAAVKQPVGSAVVPPRPEKLPPVATTPPPKLVQVLQAPNPPVPLATPSPAQPQPRATTLADLVVDETEEEAPPAPAGVKRKVNRLGRPEQRKLENYLELNWNVIKASRTTVNDTAASASIALGFPVAQGHVRPALKAVGKTWPWAGKYVTPDEARRMNAAKRTKSQLLASAVLRLYREWSLTPPEGLTDLAGEPAPKQKEETPQ